MPSVLRPNHKFLASSVKSEWSLSIFLHCDPSAGCLNFPSFLRSSLCHRSNLACSFFMNRRFNRGIIGAYHITLAGLSVPNDDEGRAPMWKKKSIFWDLPYWKHLDVRSSIDVMHVMKNLCVNLLGFLGVYGKTKDTPEAREDLQRLHEKVGMPPKQYEGPASYALTKEE